MAYNCVYDNIRECNGCSWCFEEDTSCYDENPESYDYFKIDEDIYFLNNN